MELVGRMLNTLKKIHLIVNGIQISDANYFSNWVGGGNQSLVKRFKFVRGTIIDTISNKLFSKAVQSITGNNLETLRVAIDEFDFREIDGNFWISPSFKESQINIKLASYSSLQVVFEIFREEIYSFFCKEECVVVDVGANIGIASIYFANLPNVSNVESYELVPNTFKLALQNIRASNLNQKITISSYGLAKDKGSFSIPFKEEGSVDASVFEVSPSNVKLQSGDNIEVNVLAAVPELQRIISHANGKKVVLKLDCEGSEYEIIPELSVNGILQQLSVIMLEWHYYGPEKIVIHLTECGFISLNRNIPNDGGKRGMIYAFRSV